MGARKRHAESVEYFEALQKRLIRLETKLDNVAGGLARHITESTVHQLPRTMRRETERREKKK